MRIIKAGTKPDVAKKYEVTCRACGTEFEFEPWEAARVPDHRDGDFYRVICPVCEQPVSKAV